jgi:hypothetical protein
MADKTHPSHIKVPTERSEFLFKLLSNPNYFGNISDSPVKPVQVIKSNTSYEELKCVGFSPEFSQLEGVVWIKQSGGYDGGICTSGSQEYVSFYLSYDNGVTWLLQGTVNFTVYDIAGPHPLEYAVRVPIQPEKKFCFVANLPLVRAILSWNTPPTGPNATPVWGNVIETRIQIPGFLFEIPLPILLDEAKVKLPAEVASIVGPDATIKLQQPKALSAAELHDVYVKAKVPTHRFLQNNIKSALKNPASLASANKYLSSLKVDIGAVIAALAATNGNTDFEQLECIGLEEGDGGPDALIGTLQIKLPTGYLGGPCFAGSREYVAFWIDWGAGYQYAGTASTKVHDIAAIPKEGLSFAVYLPVNLNAHRKPCEEGPVTAKVRAILSWDSPPPPANPGFVPTWGNRLETTIFVDPGTSQATGNFTPYLTSICGVDPCDIDQTSGWAHPGAGDNPFGASIAIYGVMPGQPLFVDPPANLPVYQVTVKPVGSPPGSEQILTDPFPISILKQVGGGFPTNTSHTQFAPGGFYTWQQMTPSPSGWNSVSLEGLGGGQGPLTVWNSVGEGTYVISVHAWDAAKTAPGFVAGTFICTSDGSTRQSVVIDLDQTAPVTDLQITGYKPGGVGPCINAVNCETFTVGDVICGTYSVSDEHIGGFSLQAEPTPSPTSGFTIDGSTPESGPPTFTGINGESYPTIPVTQTSKSGVWTYDTKGLPPCGYTIELFANDRTIVNCDGSWQNNSKFVGFCLVAKK